MIASSFTQARAENVASEFFNGNFLSCKNTTCSDMKDAFKTLAGMTVNQGGIKFTPMQKSYIMTLLLVSTLLSSSVLSSAFAAVAVFSALLIGAAPV